MKKGNFLGIAKNTDEDLHRLFRTAKIGDYAFVKIGAHKPKYAVYELRKGVHFNDLAFPTRIFDPYESWRKTK